MINIPIDQIKEKIANKTGMTPDQINQKIKDKLKALSGLISEEGAAHIVANELGVKLFETGGQIQISGILTGMRNVDFSAKVLQKYDVRQYKTEKGEGKVGNILVGDETGVIRVAFWHKQADLIPTLNEGDVLKISGGYVRENNGRKEVHLSEMSRVSVNPSGVVINVKPMPSAASRDYARKKISEIVEADANIEILATIVQVFDINFFEVCPQCNKRVRLREDGFACQAHGPVTPDFNFVLNIYLDDGSDNIRTVLWREQVEQLLAMKKEQVLGFKEDPSRFEQVKTDLLGNMIIVQGRASKNPTFDRIELVAQRINKNPNPEEEAKTVRAEAPRPVPQPAKDDKSGKDDFDLDSELMDIEDL